MAVAINIPVGNPNIPSDRPESIAPTNNATRAYVTMRNTGRVSVVDLMALREIDLHCRPKSPQHLRPRHQPEFSNLSYRRSNN
ncbi:hypothetical protein [Microcoleus sp. PH2017_31_RDM_U_A]|uniref:hypothetical protein n=1 Tax=Microcoleus sp. PH2017_31_RDM_U_A TaxID=2798841 RepID=UPI0025EFE747|nr:hypothetical protein [Microcoleus sp. PH2017_31_RDM_U_A]